MTLCFIGFCLQGRILCSAVSYLTTHAVPDCLRFSLRFNIMAIVQTLSKSSFIEAFKQSSRKDQFSYEALEAIFNYLEDYSDNTGEPIELDIVEICCDYNMMTIEDIINEYRIDVSDVDEDDVEQYVIDYLNDWTMVLGRCVDGVVFQCF